MSRNKVFPILKIKAVLLALILLPVLGHATEPIEMADAMRSNGKIYVVVLVLSTIFIGIILTLIYLERKIKKLEKRQS
jgi:hypothetical protein